MGRGPTAAGNVTPSLSNTPPASGLAPCRTRKRKPSTRPCGSAANNHQTASDQCPGKTASQSSTMYTAAAPKGRRRNIGAIATAIRHATPVDPTSTSATLRMQPSGSATSWDAVSWPGSSAATNELVHTPRMGEEGYLPPVEPALGMPVPRRCGQSPSSESSPSSRPATTAGRRSRSEKVGRAPGASHRHREA
jgi:hypothetical protein